MPFYLRRIQPVAIGRLYVPGDGGDGSNGTPDDRAEDGLQLPPPPLRSKLVDDHDEMVNRIYANVLRQFASLSQHTHSIFGQYVVVLVLGLLCGRRKSLFAKSHLHFLHSRKSRTGSSSFVHSSGGFSPSDPEPVEQSLCKPNYNYYVNFRKVKKKK